MFLFHQWNAAKHEIEKLDVKPNKVINLETRTNVEKWNIISFKHFVRWIERMKIYYPKSTDIFSHGI